MPSPRLTPAAHAAPQRPIPVEVLAVQDESPAIRSIRVARPPGFAFEASQTALVSLATAEGAQRRLLTIASGPARPHLEFASRRSPSAWKQAFFALRPGDQVAVMGPGRRFVLEPDRPAVLLARGIGVTPFKAMAEHAADARLATPVTLVAANPAGEAPFRAAFDALARAHPHFRALHPEAIDADLARALVAEHRTARYYVAGAPSDVMAIGQLLLAAGVPEDDLRVEGFHGYP